MLEKLKNIIRKLTPKNLVDGKCLNCGAKVPDDCPFWRYHCKQALNYPKEEM